MKHGNIIKYVTLASVSAGSFGLGYLSSDVHEALSPERQFALLLYKHHINSPLEQLRDNANELSELSRTLKSEPKNSGVTLGKMKIILDNSKLQISKLKTETPFSSTGHASFPKGQPYSGSAALLAAEVIKRIEDHSVGCALQVNHVFSNSRDIQEVCNQTEQEIADIQIVLEAYRSMLN